MNGQKNLQNLAIKKVNFSKNQIQWPLETFLLKKVILSQAKINSLTKSENKLKEKEAIRADYHFHLIKKEILSKQFKLTEGKQNKFLKKVNTVKNNLNI